MENRILIAWRKPRLLHRLFFWFCFGPINSTVACAIVFLTSTNPPSLIVTSPHPLHLLLPMDSSFFFWDPLHSSPFPRVRCSPFRFPKFPQSQVRPSSLRLFLILTSFDVLLGTSVPCRFWCICSSHSLVATFLASLVASSPSTWPLILCNGRKFLDRWQQPASDRTALQENKEWDDVSNEDNNVILEFPCPYSSRPIRWTPEGVVGFCAFRRQMEGSRRRTRRWWSSPKAGITSCRILCIAPFSSFLLTCTPHHPCDESSLEFEVDDVSA